MKLKVFFILLSLMPDDPLDSSMGEAEKDMTTKLNLLHPKDEFERKQEEEETGDEFLENHFDAPDKTEEEEFNKNEN